MVKERTDSRPCFISLFTGVGGMDLGLERAGWRCVAQVEIDQYCRRVLDQHWPNVPKFGDVREFKRSSVHGCTVDLIAGGFPCQDISNAGLRAGITGARSGLWSEFLRLIRAFRPTFALIENVAALRRRGLDKVLSDLAQSGYDAEWDCLPAAAFGAPHVRDRLFIVAHAKRFRRPRVALQGPFDRDQSGVWASGKDGRVATFTGRVRRGYPDVLRMGHGTADPVDRLRGAGNAVVPQVAEWLGSRLLTHFRQIHASRLPRRHARLTRKTVKSARRYRTRRRRNSPGA